MKKIILSILLGLFVTGCGQSGKLYLPADEVNQNHATKN